MRDFFKRIVDIVISLPAVVILLLVFAVIVIAIKLTSKGPVIFKQERAGKDGEPFVFYKFRTMKVDADPFGPSPKSGSDPRLTKVGRFLREYSLDELPQLFKHIEKRCDYCRRTAFASLADGGMERAAKETAAC